MSSKTKEKKTSGEGEEVKGSEIPLHLVADMDQTTFALVSTFLSRC